MVWISFLHSWRYSSPIFKREARNFYFSVLFLVCSLAVKYSWIVIEWWLKGIWFAWSTLGSWHWNLWKPVPLITEETRPPCQWSAPTFRSRSSMCAPAPGDLGEEQNQQQGEHCSNLQGSAMRPPAVRLLVNLFAGPAGEHFGAIVLLGPYLLCFGLFNAKSACMLYVCLDRHWLSFLSEDSVKSWFFI